MLRKSLVHLVIVAFGFLSLVQAGQAALISTGQVVSAQQTDARALVLQVLERADVQAKLEEYGVSKAAAEQRIDAMSDEEVSRLAGHIQNDPAGGISVLGVALIVFLVLLLTDILGYTKIFPFTKPIK
jgi:hypothetical protein